ncbi:hypothetical protein OESDEN_02598 [Oesophagostomum dentatum]|uniref:Protein kinase domain-containing protein n=1 Tax=Oesophagostomum dentatum TaxID=61180 RepID=A0A0B1TNK4_OESDE|nr:hypothetical protein OESDEN_02598 [Oesophagostomum dentatum]
MVETQYHDSSDAIEELGTTESNKAPVVTSEYNTAVEGEVRVDPTQYTEFGINQSPEERQTLLEELKMDHANLLDKEKPELIFVLNESDIVEGTTLEEHLHKHGPFPLEEHIAARILRSISSALMFLHSRDVIHGSLDLTSIIVCPNFSAKTIVTTKAYRAKHSESGAKAKVEDVFHLGLILYQMITGRKAEFDQGGQLTGGPSPYLRVSEKGLKLAELMLTKSVKFPPTIGHIRYSEWLEQCEDNPPVFVLFPDYE